MRVSWSALIWVCWLSLVPIAALIGLNTPTTPPEEKSFDFKYSDNCLAEMREIPQKILDFEKEHGFIPPNKDFNPRCMKEETNTWMINECLKKPGRTAGSCRNDLKVIECLDKWDDSCTPAVEAYRKEHP